MAIKIMPDAAYLRECFSYNPETGVVLRKERPREHFKSDAAHKTTNKKYAGKVAGCVAAMKSGVTYVKIGLDYSEFLAHRLIHKIVTGEEPSDEIDHRDGDGFNNRWANIREATHQQNQCNTKLRIGTKYPRGVYRIHNNYAASIRAHGKRRNLGTYKTPEEAHAAYLAAAAELHQEFSHAAR